VNGLRARISNWQQAVLSEQKEGVLKYIHLTIAKNILELKEIGAEIKSKVLK
jgi:hypothetical protein